VGAALSHTWHNVALAVEALENVAAEDFRQSPEALYHTAAAHRKTYLASNDLDQTIHSSADLPVWDLPV